LEVVLLTIALLVLNPPIPPSVVWDSAQRQDWKWNGQYTWTQVEKAEWMEELCRGQTHGWLVGCVNNLTDGSCEVFSAFPESMARFIFGPAGLESLRDHELKHCDGFRHRSIFDEAEA